MGFLKIHQLPKGTQINDKDEFLYSDINGDTKTVTADKVHSFIKSKQQSGAAKLEAALKDHDKRIKENKAEIAKPHHTTMVVTAMTEGIGFKSDYNSTQIKKHADAGGTIILRFNAPDGSGEQSYNYETYKDGFAIFRRAAIIGGKSKRIVIKINDLFNVYKTEEDANYYTKEETVTLVSDRAGNKVTLNVDENFIMTLKLLNAKGNELSRAAIDLPLETMVVNAKFDSKTKELVIVLENGNELRVPIGDLVKGLVSQNTFDAAVKDLQQQIIANNDELNNLVIEVSDVQQDIGLIRKDQTLQNKAIQKNVDDIHENKRNIGSNTNRVQNIENALYNSGQAEGEFINVKDSTLAEQQLVEMSIAKVQETTEGYQLFSTIKFNNEKLNDAVINSLPNGEFMVNGNVTKSANLPLFKTDDRKYFPAGTYTIQILSDAGFRKQAEFYYSYDDGKPIYAWVSPKAEFIANKPFKVESFNLYFNVFNYQNTKIGILLSKKEFSSKPYEKYTGGMPSPNPDHPQEINKVEGGFDYESCGKNLSNNKFVKGTIVIETGIPADSPYNIRTENIYNEIEDKIYTLSVNYTCICWACFYDKNKKILGYKNIFEGNNKGTFAPLKNAKYFGYYFIKPSELTQDEFLQKAKVQLEISPSATPYEPYTGTTTNIDLKGNTMLPNDKLRLAFKIPERLPHALLDKNEEEYIITGLEPWLGYNGGTHTKTISFTAPILEKANFWYRVENLYCNLLKAVDGGMREDIENIAVAEGTYIYITINKDRLETEDLDGFIKWLKANQVKIAYPVSDEYKQTIDLGTIDLMPFTFFPETNVFTSIDNININMKYYQNPVNTQKYIKDTLKDLDARIKALESKPAEVVQVIQEPTESEVQA